MAARQHNVFTRAQAADAGFTVMMARRRRADGRWVELLPGVYRFSAASPSFRMRALAAVLWGGSGLVSHVTAANLWGLEGVVRQAEVHLTVSADRRLRHGSVVVHRTNQLLPADRSVAYGIPATSAMRTVLDLAAMLDADRLELAIEDGLRRGLFTVGQLQWRIGTRAGKGIAGSAIIRDLMGRRGSTITESGWEVRLEQMLARAGLPRPVRQMKVATASGNLHVDLGYPGPPMVALEYDSDRWHSGVRRRHADMRRRNALRAAGCVVVEVTSALMQDPGPLLDVVAAVTRRTRSPLLLD